MPHTAKTHSDNQASICGVCLTKNTKLLRNITAPVLEWIRKLKVFEDYNKTEDECGKDWTWLPNKICHPCHGILNKAWHKEKKRQEEEAIEGDVQNNPYQSSLISHIDYTNLKPPNKRLTREHPRCECSLCELGRLRNREYLDLLSSIKEPRGRPIELTPKKEPEAILICSECRTEIGLGKNHKCYPSDRRNNVVQAIAASGSSTRRQILTDSLREVMADAGCSSGGTLSLTGGFGGKPLTITRGVVQKPKVKFPHGSLFMLQKKHGITDKGMKGLCQWLRVHAGRDVVDPFFREAMYERNHAFDNFFRHEKIKFQEYYTPDHEIEFGPDGKKKKKPKQEVREVEKSIAYCSDVNAFVTEVMAERGLDPERVVIQIGLDDGQNLIKVKFFPFQHISLKMFF